MPEVLHEVTRGGITWVAKIRFDADPATRGDEMQVFQFRTPSQDRTAGLYTHRTTGNLVFQVCISSSCEQVTTATPVPGVWMLVAARYVHDDRRMELWVDGGVVSWPDTLVARAQVCLLSCAFSTPRAAFPMVVQSTWGCRQTWIVPLMPCIPAAAITLEHLKRRSF